MFFANFNNIFMQSFANPFASFYPAQNIFSYRPQVFRGQSVFNLRSQGFINQINATQQLRYQIYQQNLQRQQQANYMAYLNSIQAQRNAQSQQTQANQQSQQTSQYPKVDSKGWKKGDKNNVLNLSVQRLTEMGFDTPSKREAFYCLKPEMQIAIDKLTKYAEANGIKIGYKSKRSIFRTYQEQAAIYKTARKGYAARPGHSKHESGQAVDLYVKGANAASKREKLGRYWEKNLGYFWGAHFKTIYEPWHFDLRKA